MSLSNVTEESVITHALPKKDPQITALALARLRQVQSELEKQSTSPSTAPADETASDSNMSFNTEFYANDSSTTMERNADALWIPSNQRKVKRRSRGGYNQRSNVERFNNQRRNEPTRRSLPLSHFDIQFHHFHPHVHENDAKYPHTSHRLDDTPDSFLSNRFMDTPFVPRSSSGEYQDSPFNCAGYSATNLNYQYSAPGYQQSTDMKVRNRLPQFHRRHSCSPTPDQLQTYTESRSSPANPAAQQSCWDPSSSLPRPSFPPYMIDDADENPVHENPSNNYMDSPSLQRSNKYQYRKIGTEDPTSSSMNQRRSSRCRDEYSSRPGTSPELIGYDRFGESGRLSVVSPQLMQNQHPCSAEKPLIVRRTSALSGNPFSPRNQHLGDGNSDHSVLNAKRRRTSETTSIASTDSGIRLQTKSDEVECQQENEFTAYERRNTASSDPTLAERITDGMVKRTFGAQESLPQNNWVDSCPNLEHSGTRGHAKVQCWIVTKITRPSGHIGAIQSLFRERCSVSSTVVYDDKLGLYGGRELLNYLDGGRPKNSIGPSGQTLVRAAVLVGADTDQNSLVRVVVEEACGELQDAKSVTLQDGVTLVLRTVLRASMSRGAKADGRVKDNGRVTDNCEVNQTSQPVEPHNSPQEVGHGTHRDVHWRYESQSNPLHRSSIPSTLGNLSHGQRIARSLPGREWEPVINTNGLSQNSQEIRTPTTEHWHGSLYQCADNSQRLSTPAPPAPPAPTDVRTVLTPGVKSMLSTLQQQIALGHDIGGLSILNQYLPSTMSERNHDIGGLSDLSQCLPPTVSERTQGGAAYPESGTSRSSSISMLTPSMAQQMRSAPHGRRLVQQLSCEESFASCPSNDVNGYRHLEELLAKLHTPEIERTTLVHPTNSPLTRPRTQLKMPLQQYTGMMDGTSGTPTSAGNSDIPLLPIFSPITSHNSSSKATAPASSTGCIPTPPALTAKSEDCNMLQNELQAQRISYPFPFTPYPDAREQAAYPSNASNMGTLPTLKNMPDVKRLTSILAAARATGNVEQSGMSTGSDHCASVSSNRISRHEEGNSFSSSLNVKELDLLVQKLRSNRQVSGIAERRSDGGGSM